MEVSVGLKLDSLFKFRESHFGTLYLSNQAELDFRTLSKVGDLAYLYNFRYNILCQNRLGVTKGERLMVCHTFGVELEFLNPCCVAIMADCV